MNWPDGLGEGEEELNTSLWEGGCLSGDWFDEFFFFSLLLDKIH